MCRPHLLACVSLLLICCGEKDAAVTPADPIIDAPHQFLPAPPDCPQDLTYISHTVENGTAFVANYKRSMKPGKPDYLTVRVELGADIQASVANYQLLRHRLQQGGSSYLRSIEGLGERSAMLTISPTHILLQRANVVMEVGAERLPESAMGFARLLDQRLQAHLEGKATRANTQSESDLADEKQAPAP
jgi:major membrane immunogen (membrane-anchored lipoprotein)